MLNKKTVILGTAALASFSSSYAAEVNQSDSEFNIVNIGSESIFANVPCHAKASDQCPKNPVVKNPIEPIVKNDVVKNQTEVSEVLQCLHFVESHLKELDGPGLSVEEEEKLESCLELFAESLLD